MRVRSSYGCYFVVITVYGRFQNSSVKCVGEDQLQQPPFFFASPSFKLKAFSISRSSRSLSKLIVEKTNKREINKIDTAFKDIRNCTSFLLVLTHPIYPYLYL